MNPANLESNFGTLDSVSTESGYESLRLFDEVLSQLNRYDVPKDFQTNNSGNNNTNGYDDNLKRDQSLETTFDRNESENNTEDPCEDYEALIERFKRLEQENLDMLNSTDVNYMRSIATQRVYANVLLEVLGRHSVRWDTRWERLETELEDIEDMYSDENQKK